MITGVTVKASVHRLARWKRLAAKGRLVQLAITSLMALVAMTLPVLPAQAAADTQILPGLHLMWSTKTAMRIGWSARPKAASYTYQLYQMNGVRVRSGAVPGYYHTVICSGLHPGWSYRADVQSSSDLSATISVTLALLDPLREIAYQWAESQAGTPYLYGGQGDGGYDCSGLVRTAYRHAGIWLPRTTGEMLQYWRLDQESSPRQGDLVFFGSGHVELYAGPERSFGAETSSTGTWWNRWWPGDWWPTAFYRVSGAG